MIFAHDTIVGMNRPKKSQTLLYLWQGNIMYQMLLPTVMFPVGCQIIQENWPSHIQHHLFKDLGTEVPIS